jgi:hypothetical protein
LPNNSKCFGLPNQNNNPKGGRDGVRELELGWEGRERDDDPLLSSLRSSKIIFLLKQTGFYHLDLERVSKKKKKGKPFITQIYRVSYTKVGFFGFFPPKWCYL